MLSAAMDNLPVTRPDGQGPCEHRGAMIEGKSADDLKKPIGRLQFPGDPDDRCRSRDLCEGGGHLKPNQHRKPLLHLSHGLQ